MTLTQHGFGGRLRALRTRSGLTLEGLADASGVSARAISDMERGRSRTPRPRTVAALVAALGLDASEGDELATLARAARETAATGRPRMCDLPRRSGQFVGRDAELTAVEAALAAGGSRVAVVHGPPGVGKTGLAIHAAEQLEARFPDGRFYVDLRGIEARPASLGEAQSMLLRALGVSSRQIAHTDDDRTGQLRSILRERRCLVILDNAGSEAQVRGLLPEAGPSGALVTSRRALGGLEDVQRLALRPLSPAESAELLITMSGKRGPEADEISRLCGHLPLALRIAGTRLASRPGWSMGRLVEHLSDADQRLAALTPDGSGVETAFAVSYAQLPERDRLVFRRLAHVPTTSFSAAAASVLAECSRHDAEDMLEELLDLGLLQPEGHDRYRFHDLIRLFATSRLRAEEPAAARDAAGERLVAWYLDTAIAAGRWFEPAYGRAPDRWRNPVPLDTAEQAQQWLQAEFDGFLEAMRRAAAAGDHQRVVDVAESLHWYSDRTFSVDPWTAVFTASRESAARLPDGRQEAVHLNYLAWALAACDGLIEESAATAREAHRIAVEAGDQAQQAYALRYVGESYVSLDRNDDAIDLLSASTRLADAAGDHDHVVQIMVATGRTLYLAGRLDEAAALMRRTLDEIERRPLTPAPAEVARLTAWNGMAKTLAAGGRWPEALAAAERLLPLTEEFGEPRLVAEALLTLGQSLAETGDVEGARARLTRALSLYSDGARRTQADRIALVEELLARLDDRGSA